LIAMLVVALQDLVSRLADAVGPWQSLYADSKVVSATVNFAHVGALLVGGGMAIGADRPKLSATRRPPPDSARQHDELATLHGVVLASLAVVAVSGVALFLADVEEFAGSVIFWVKMGFLALLLANGALMVRLERSLRDGNMTIAEDGHATRIWERLRWHAMASVALWITITLFGVILREG
jgi:hypothetical protein